MSVLSDTASSYHDLEDGPEVASSSDPKFVLTWEDLLHCNQYINDERWSNTSVPLVLDTYPENIVINDQLQHIISWSLQRLESLPTNPPIAEPIHDDVEIASETAQQKALTRSNTVVAPITVAVHDIPILPMRAKSHRTLPLVTRLNRLRQDVANKIASAGSSRSVNINDSQPSSSQAAVAEVTRECISCFDELAQHDLVHLKCSHDYCKPCLREVVFTAMKNEAAFPPKCCLTEIALKTVLVCLDNTQRDEYREKSAEYAIPAGHRWYCPQPTCSKWIRPERLQRDRRTPQTCPHCEASICSMCRALAHNTNQDCPQDFGLESTLEIAESEGWRRCYSCRTMVELTTGCRHITCRCGAEFCYVCNAIWRTCSCTEADKERRIRELRAQRGERAQMQEEERRRREEEDEAARLEAEEMAEALRQVEEWERQDAIRRVEEERQRQLEEELMLAQLEEARLLEEIARRDEEEEAERQFRQILVTSSEEECQAMMKTLMDIINHQHAALISSHTIQEQNIMEQHDVQKAQQASDSDTMFSWLHENVNRRTTAIEMKQRSERESLLLQIENEEDEMFMDMHIHLRGKPNREQREKRMRDAFQHQQQERTLSLQRNQQVERQRFEMGIGYEFEGLKKAASERTEGLEREHDNILERFGGHVGCERQWLQTVSTRRINMLNEYMRIVLEQLEAEKEPIGLTENQARLIEPILPAAGVDVAARPHTTSLEESVQHLQTETTDLYGAGSDAMVQPNIVAGPMTLSRSNTVVRSPVGNSPVLIISRPTIDPISQHAASPSVRHSQAQIDTDNITTTSSSLPNPKHLSADSYSSSSTSASTSSSTPSIASSDTSFTPSLLNEMRSSIIAQHAKESENSGKGKGRAGIFRFGRKKELTEEEIRRRMSRSVFGDGTSPLIGGLV